MDKITGLEAGADDYIAKPFSPRELLARISSILRRSAETEEDFKTMTYEDITLNTEKMELICDGKVVPVTKNEYDILEKIMSAK